MKIVMRIVRGGVPYLSRPDIGGEDSESLKRGTSAFEGMACKAGIPSAADTTNIPATIDVA